MRITDLYRTGRYPESDLLPAEARSCRLTFSSSTTRRSCAARSRKCSRASRTCASSGPREMAKRRSPKLRSVAPDVITMDVEMPGMGGLEAVRQIAAQHRHSDHHGQCADARRRRNDLPRARTRRRRFHRQTRRRIRQHQRRGARSHRQNSNVRKARRRNRCAEHVAARPAGTSRFRAVRWADCAPAETA